MKRKHAFWPKPVAGRRRSSAGSKVSAKCFPNNSKRRRSIPPRRLLKVELQDALDTDLTFRDLMGKRTEARYEFLMANAALADNLDV